MDIRNFFFKYRSYTPIPIGIMIIFFARPSSSYLIFGITLLFIGESIRMWAVSYAGGVTRTRKVGAPQLCTSGPYAYVRNPLYVGNMMMYLGVVFVAGAANVYLMAATTVGFFLIQYSLIISLEEETLKGLFGNNYELYKENVPAILPRLTQWKSNDKRNPQTLLKTIKTEKRTLQNVVLIITLVILRINLT
tara:strand:+ start:66 stop:641 length:576 start_codon:yes stop_codon:yes gene_type:complete